MAITGGLSWNDALMPLRPISEIVPLAGVCLFFVSDGRGYAMASCSLVMLFWFFVWGRGPPKPSPRYSTSKPCVILGL